MDALEAHLQDELSRVLSVLEGITGLESRWTGVVHLSDDVSARGRMSWSGDISSDRELAQSDLRWRTLIHEALHTLSQGLTPSSYLDLRGWEEGVVEHLQRFFRPGLLSGLGFSVPESTFEETERDHRFNRYIEVLEAARSLLDTTEEEFYLALLKTPLSERPAHMIHLAKQLPPEQYAAFQRQFGVWTVILKGDPRT